MQVSRFNVRKTISAVLIAVFLGLGAATAQTDATTVTSEPARTKNSQPESGAVQNADNQGMHSATDDKASNATANNSAKDKKKKKQKQQAKADHSNRQAETGGLSEYGGEILHGNR